MFSSGSGLVAGCMVVEGKLVKGCGIRVLRKGKTAYTGQLDSLRRVKEIVKEVCINPCTRNLIYLNRKKERERIVVKMFR